MLDQPLGGAGPPKTLTSPDTSPHLTSPSRWAERLKVLDPGATGSERPSTRRRASDERSSVSFFWVLWGEGESCKKAADAVIYVFFLFLSVVVLSWFGVAGVLFFWCFFILLSNLLKVPCPLLLCSDLFCLLYVFCPLRLGLRLRVDFSDFPGCCIFWCFFREATK